MWPSVAFAQEAIEGYLSSYLGASKVIWLGLGVYGDEDTNGACILRSSIESPRPFLAVWVSSTTFELPLLYVAVTMILDALVDLARSRA